MQTSRVLLTLALAFAANVTRLCLSSPHEASKHLKEKGDTLFNIPVLNRIGPQSMVLVNTILASFHTLLIPFSDYLDEHPDSPLCPHWDAVDKSYFTWSPWVTFYLILIILFGYLRLQAYKALGKNFTFQLATPDKLVTTGIYSYVQHPSYGPLLLVIHASMFLFQSPDGVAACFLPAWIVQAYVAGKWLIRSGFVAMTAAAVRVRVIEEEAMLKRTFGKEWEEWHQRTPRFIPYLF